MPQAHSLLWHYLWVAPHVLQLGLALVLWRRGLHRQFPVFFAYLIFEAVEELLLYALDVSPAVSSETWWSVFLPGAVIEGLLRFAIVAELWRHLMRPWTALARAGAAVIRAVVVTLILGAAVVVALHEPNRNHLVIKIAHPLQQSFFLVQAGLTVSIFLFASYFKISWPRMAFGIAFGFAIDWCGHLAVWTILNTTIATSARASLDMVNLATYHLTVMVWAYYILVPETAGDDDLDLPADPTLDIWNRELERLLQ